MRIGLMLGSLLAAVLSAAAVRAEEMCVAPFSDVDYDGVCDANDPCTSGDDKLKESALTLGRLTDAGGETLRFSGILLFLHDKPVDLASTGLRLISRNAFGAEGDLVLDVAAPAGTGWKGGQSRSAWRYRDTLGVAGPVRSVTVRRIGGWLGLYEAAYFVTVDARNVGLPPLSDLETHKVTVLFDASATTTDCGDGYFYPWLITGVPGVPPYEPSEWAPRCKFRTGDRRLRCTSGPRVGPCRASLPRDLTICDTIGTAQAEEAYRAEHGTYFTGPCDALPGVGSPGVTCTTAGTATAFTVTASFPEVAYACTWSSAAPVGQYIVCE